MADIYFTTHENTGRGAVMDECNAANHDRIQYALGYLNAPRIGCLMTYIDALMDLQNEETKAGYAEVAHV